jgi:hypothetical protein
VFSTVLARNFLSFLGDFHLVDSHLAIHFLSCASPIFWGIFSTELALRIFTWVLNPASVTGMEETTNRKELNK